MITDTRRLLQKAPWDAWIVATMAEEFGISQQHINENPNFFHEFSKFMYRDPLFNRGNLTREESELFSWRKKIYAVWVALGITIPCSMVDYSKFPSRIPSSCS